MFVFTVTCNDGNGLLLNEVCYFLTDEKTFDPDETCKSLGASTPIIKTRDVQNAIMSFFRSKIVGESWDPNFETLHLGATYEVSFLLKFSFKITLMILISVKYNLL